MRKFYDEKKDRRWQQRQKKNKDAARWPVIFRATWRKSKFSIVSKGVLSSFTSLVANLLKIIKNSIESHGIFTIYLTGYMCPTLQTQTVKFWKKKRLTEPLDTITHLFSDVKVFWLLFPTYFLVSKYSLFPHLGPVTDTLRVTHKSRF